MIFFIYNILYIPHYSLLVQNGMTLKLLKLLQIFTIQVFLLSHSLSLFVYVFYGKNHQIITDPSSPTDTTCLSFKLNATEVIGFEWARNSLIKDK